jgi:hypothetical protein
MNNQIVDFERKNLNILHSLPVGILFTINSIFNCIHKLRFATVPQEGKLKVEKSDKIHYCLINTGRAN